jgi:hypothetical protein
MPDDNRRATDVVDLSLIQTEMLVAEVIGRFTVAIFCGVKQLDGDRSQSSYQTTGNPMLAAGVAETMRQMLVSEYLAGDET